MKKFFALLLAGAMTLSVAACGGTDMSMEASTELNIYMWQDYISDELITNFEAENNCTVNLSYMNDSDEAFEKLTADSTEYDLVMTRTEYMQELIDEDHLKKIDKANVPNCSTLNDDFWLSKSYSIPYLMNYLYVVYDTETCPVEITSYSDLLDPALKGQIATVDGARNLFAMALIALGYDPNTTEESEIVEVYDWLVKFSENAVVKDDAAKALTKGEVSVAVTYDRVAAKAMAKKDTIEIAPFIKDTVQLQTDLFVIPAEAAHVDLAEKFLNYICDPEVMTENLKEFPYSCPNDAAVIMSSEAYKNAPERQFAYDENIFFQKGVGETQLIYDEYYQQLNISK